MQHIFKRDILPYVNDMLPLLKQAEHSNGSSYVQTALVYLFMTGEMKDSQEFLEMVQAGLSPETRGDIMTGAQQIRAKGIEEGMQKGEILARQAMAKKLIREGLPLDTVSRVTGFSVEELNSL